MKKKIERKLDAGELEAPRQLAKLEEKKSFQEYFKQSAIWQRNMLYIGIAIAMILLGIFIRLVTEGL